MLQGLCWREVIYSGVSSSFDVVLAKNSGDVDGGKTERGREDREKDFRLRHFDDAGRVKHTESFNGIFANRQYHCATREQAEHCPQFHSLFTTLKCSDTFIQCNTVVTFIFTFLEIMNKCNISRNPQSLL